MKRDKKMLAWFDLLLEEKFNIGIIKKKCDVAVVLWVSCAVISAVYHQTGRPLIQPL